VGDKKALRLQNTSSDAPVIASALFGFLMGEGGHPIME